MEDEPNLLSEAAPMRNSKIAFVRRMSAGPGSVYTVLARVEFELYTCLAFAPSMVHSTAFGSDHLQSNLERHHKFERR